MRKLADWLGMPDVGYHNFMYNPSFLKKGLNISPLVAPVDGGTIKYFV